MRKRAGRIIQTRIGVTALSSLPISEPFLSKRVLLYLDIQKKLGITLPARELPEVKMVQELAEMIVPLLQKA
mgnify:CR=1 FL=1